jgi:hypothetical protein
MQSSWHGHVAIGGKPSLGLHKLCFAPYLGTSNLLHPLKMAMCSLSGGNLG